MNLFWFAMVKSFLQRLRHVLVEFPEWSSQVEGFVVVVEDW